jgi:hypothetical protein
MTWPFSKKPEPEDEPKERIMFTQPRPSVFLRELRQPLFDTEWCSKPISPVCLFQRPMGQYNMRGEEKTAADTNMLIGNQLPEPMQFDFWQWRTEFSPDVPLDLIRNFRFCSRLDFQFGERVWFSVPLSFVPFQATVGVEELRQAMSVLVVDDKNKFEAAWEKARIVKSEDIAKLADQVLKQDKHEIYRTELAQRVSNSSGRPWRIRAQETFVARLYTDWDAKLKLPEMIAARVYLEGYLYRAI